MPLDHCQSHEEHNKNMSKLWDALDAVRAKVNNQDGRWIILALIIVAAIGFGWKAIDRIDASVSRIADATVRMDKNFSVYMAESTKELNQVKARLLSLEDDVKDMQRSQR